MTWNNTPKNLKEIKDGKIVEDIPEGGEALEGGEEGEPAQEDKIEKKSE